MWRVQGIQRSTFNAALHQNFTQILPLATVVTTDPSGINFMGIWEKRLKAVEMHGELSNELCSTEENWKLLKRRKLKCRGGRETEREEESGKGRENARRQNIKKRIRGRIILFKICIVLQYLYFPIKLFTGAITRVVLEYSL